MLTCSCNVDPLTPRFYIVNLGFTGVYIVFLIIPPANCVCGWLYPPQTVFVGGYTVFTLSVRPSECVCACVRNVLFP